MSYTAPATWTAGEIPTATKFNTHLRDNVIALEDTWRHVLVTRTTSIGLPEAAWESAVWLTEVLDDWSGWASGTPTIIQVPATAVRVTVGATFMFTSATGTGDVQAKILHNDSADVLKATVAHGSGPMNGAVTMAALVDCAASDKFVFQSRTFATGTQHSYTGRAWVKMETVV